MIRPALAQEEADRDIVPISRRLSADDIRHYQRIVAALSKTIRLMSEIDRVIAAHGGWPDVFVTDKRAEAGR